MEEIYEIPKSLRYTSKNEWVKTTDQKIAIVGITDYAQRMMREIVFVELPEIGKRIKKMESIATVESVKSISEVFSPLSGEVWDVNKELEGKPELINKDPYGRGWIFKLKIDDVKEVEELMDSKKYEEYINSFH